jgi:hypothetical protein
MRYFPPLSIRNDACPNQLIFMISLLRLDSIGIVEPVADPPDKPDDYPDLVWYR